MGGHEEARNFQGSAVEVAASKESNLLNFHDEVSNDEHYRSGGEDRRDTVHQTRLQNEGIRMFEEDSSIHFAFEEDFPIHFAFEDLVSYGPWIFHEREHPQEVEHSRARTCRARPSGEIELQIRFS